MKRMTLVTLLFTTFALSIHLPRFAFSLETSPLFEKTSLTRKFASQTYLYVFDFDFVNHLSQPIEIISVSVYNMNGHNVEQAWEASGPNWDPRLMTHALSGDHPLVKIISKPRGTPLEQATVTPAGDRIKITVTNRILSGGEGIRPSLYLLSSKTKYDSLVLRVAYRINGNLQEISRTFTIGIPEGLEEPSLAASHFQFQGLPVPLESIEYINWYGNTEFAYQNQTGIYKELQGLHSGIDFIAPCETPIKSVVNRSGEVVSINNAPPVARAGPGSVLIDYGDFLVLYGHTQKDKRPENITLGAKVNPNDTIAYVGSDAQADGCDGKMASYISFGGGQKETLREGSHESCDLLYSNSFRPTQGESSRYWSQVPSHRWRDQVADSRNPT